MSDKKDDALALSNPRLLSGIYFGVLAVILAILTNAILYNLGVKWLLPTFKIVILSAVVACCFGALFGEKIVHCPSPYRLKTFLFGVLMVVIALPIYDLGFLYLEQHSIQAVAQYTLKELLLFYLFILLYSFILVGLWVAIAAGFAAMYLRSRIVYDILQE